ncbi:hypothetical protein ACFYW6_37380 [Streptomyces sp. NPDC002659]|uniref:hypothetical protein n=1 Tax=Streptomyces sp. NPDC002659 TaxID=3364656 RepID=UPI0036B61B6B
MPVQRGAQGFGRGDCDSALVDGAHRLGRWWEDPAARPGKDITRYLPRLDGPATAFEGAHELQCAQHRASLGDGVEVEGGQQVGQEAGDRVVPGDQHFLESFVGLLCQRGDHRGRGVYRVDFHRIQPGADVAVRVGGGGADAQPRVPQHQSGGV